MVEATAAFPVQVWSCMQLCVVAPGRSCMYSPWTALPKAANGQPRCVTGMQTVLCDPSSGIAELADVLLPYISCIWRSPGWLVFPTFQGCGVEDVPVDIPDAYSLGVPTLVMSTHARGSMPGLRSHGAGYMILYKCICCNSCYVCRLCRWHGVTDTRSN